MLDRFQILTKAYNSSDVLTTKNVFYGEQVVHYLYGAFLQDVGMNGDITSHFCVPEGEIGNAKIVAKSDGVIAGIEEIHFFLDYLIRKDEQKFFSPVEFQFLKKDGDQIKDKEVLATVKGNVRDILLVERTILNALQRMSGIATLMAKYVAQVPSSVLVVPTRKTLWGNLDKRACVLGGGASHRLNLSDAILVKDTHVALLDHDFKKLFELLEKSKNVGRFIEVEVENSKDALAAAKYGSDFFEQSGLKVPFCLMFDNIKPKEIKNLIGQIQNMNFSKDIFFEASGGITLRNVRDYAESGVDVVSVGEITHSSRALDISLRMENL